MKYAIVQKPHGRPGAMLQSLQEAEKDCETIARLKRLPPNFVKTIFKNAGYNVFNPVWKDFVNYTQNR